MADRMQIELERAYDRLEATSAPTRHPTHFHWCAQCEVPMTCGCDNDRRRDLLCLECGGEADFNRKLMGPPTNG